MNKSSYIVLALVLTIIGLNQTSWAEGSGTIDSLSARLQKDIHDTDRVKLLNDLAWKLKFVNIDTAIILSTEARSISEAYPWPIGIARSMGYQGTFNYLIGEYGQALEYLFAALAIDKGLESSGNPWNVKAGKSGIAIRISIIGIVFDEQGNYPQALEYYLEAVRMNEELGDQKGIAINLGNIGIIYRNQREDSLALKYFNEALAMNEKLGRKNGMSVNLGNIGNVYDKQEDFKRSLEYYFRALAIDEELDNNYGISRHLGNIGEIYRNQGKYAEAMEYYIKAHGMSKELGDKNSVARHLGNLGTLYIDIGEFEKAEVNLQRALTLSRQVGAKEYLKSQYESLSLLYDQTTRPAKAFKAYKLYITYSDSLDNEENTKAQTRTEMKYEYEKAELVKQQEEKEQARTEAEVKDRRDNLQYSVILIAILTLFGGVLALGFINVSERMAEGVIFFSFLILFEFLLVLADPYIDKWSGGAPGIKLLFNAGIAALIFPAHAFFEARLKGRLRHGDMPWVKRR